MPNVFIYIREDTWDRIMRKTQIQHDRRKAIKEIHDLIENSFP